MSDDVKFWVVAGTGWGGAEIYEIISETPKRFTVRYTYGDRLRNKPGQYLRCSTFEEARDAQRKLRDILSAHSSQKAEMHRKHQAQLEAFYTRATARAVAWPTPTPKAQP